MSDIKQLLSETSDALGYQGIFVREIAAEVIAAAEAEIARRWPKKVAPQPIDLDAIFGDSQPQGGNTQ